MEFIKETESVVPAMAMGDESTVNSRMATFDPLLRTKIMKRTSPKPLRDIIGPQKNKKQKGI
jgi:hypothetical protein